MSGIISGGIGRVRPVSSTSFSTTETTKSVTLTRYPGYVALILEITNSSGSVIPVNSLMNTEEFIFEILVDGNTLIQYSKQDAVLANQMLGNFSPGVSNGTTVGINNNTSWIIPTAYTKGVPAKSLSEVCLSSVNASTIELLITKKAGVALNIRINAVITDTSRPTGINYLYIQRITGVTNSFITGLTAETNARLLGYTFVVDDGRASDKISIQVQDDYLVEKLSPSSIGAVFNALGGQYEYQALPDAANQYHGAVDVNGNNQFLKGVLMKNNYITTFNIESTEDSPVTITQYQIRGITS